MLPLTGIRVLDFSRLLPGPFATLFLAETGAEVIKLEHPDGEDMRHYAPAWDDESGAPFALLNKGKKSIAADLSDPEDLAAVKKLAASVDIIVEQFRPGTMHKYGLDYASVAAANPRTIYCSISGYGQTGPWSGRAGHDLNYLSESGVLDLSPGQPGARTIPPVAFTDLAGGSYPAVINILLALRYRDQTGAGCHIDIAMADSLLPFAYLPWAEGHVANEWPASGRGRFTGGSPRYGLYDTKDGCILAVGAIEDKFWRIFCAAIGLDPVLADDTADPTATIVAIRDIIAAHDAGHWSTVFATAECCCSIVQSMKEALNSDHFKARLPLHRKLHAGGRDLPVLPLPLAPNLIDKSVPVKPAPVLGSANAEFGLRDRPHADRKSSLMTRKQNPAVTETPLRLFSGTVDQGWIDYNGHMTEFRYLYVFGETTDRFLVHLGINLDEARIGTYYTLESHIRHLKESHPGTTFTTETELLAYDEKRIHLFHRFIIDGAVHATGEHLCLHVVGSRAAAAGAPVAENLARIFGAQIGRPIPERSGAVLTKALQYSRPV
jgi:alpha-methylacyl-CoA racemase